MARLKVGARFSADHSVWRVDDADDAILSIEFTPEEATTYGPFLRGPGYGAQGSYGIGLIHAAWDSIAFTAAELKNVQSGAALLFEKQSRQMFDDLSNRMRAWTELNRKHDAIMAQLKAQEGAEAAEASDKANKGTEPE